MFVNYVLYNKQLGNRTRLFHPITALLATSIIDWLIFQFWMLDIVNKIILKNQKQNLLFSKTYSRCAHTMLTGVR